MWGIRRLTLAGYTAGTAGIYIDDIEPIPYQAAGMYTFGRGEMLLDSGQRLVVQATGITGTVTLFGCADCFPRDYLPIYMGIGKEVG
jgi:hypothetical protein